MLLLVTGMMMGCPGPAETKDSGDGTDTADTGEPAVDICAAEEVPCVDEMILDLSLQTEVSGGGVTTSTEGADFVTVVDATAGGYSAASRNPWVYIRFDDDGAAKVEVDDEGSLESQDWHMGLKRYNIRLNSGDGGPSCVMGAKVRGSAYEDVTAVPAELAEEDFYDASCAMVEDNSGLGGPAFLMGDWWSYGACVETTMVPFVIQLDDGRAIKLVVEAYYEGDGQTECNDGGGTSAESGWITLRWSFL